MNLAPLNLLNLSVKLQKYIPGDKFCNEIHLFAEPL